jgi:ABC-2 type transport system ATP-binding protein
MLLTVNHLQKNFGTNRVLSDVSFQAESGSALGLLGRNGAGKTTTIRIIMQVFAADQGEILLDGSPLGNCDVSFGYLPEEKGLYPKQTIRNQLVYLARLRGLSMGKARQAVQFWLERMDLSQYLDKKLETLSKGNQQKIQLALALLHDPDIVILDEPFSGLDPVNAQLLKDIVHEQVRSGKIILFSSHQMNYVEQFCDQVAILHQGAIKAAGSVRELKRGYAQNRLQVRFATGSAHGGEMFAGLLASHPDLSSIVAHHEATADSCLIRLHQASDRRQILRVLAESGIDLEHFGVVEPTLEEIFVEKVGDVQ